MSNIISSVAAQAPSQMSPIVTTMSDTSVVFTWIAPSDNGSPITSYKVEFYNQNELLFNHIPSLCDPILTLTCTIPMKNFTLNLRYIPG
jgi:hypothetical protein